MKKYIIILIVFMAPFLYGAGVQYEILGGAFFEGNKITINKFYGNSTKVEKGKEYEISGVCEVPEIITRGMPRLWIERRIILYSGDVRKIDDKKLSVITYAKINQKTGEFNLKFKLKNADFLILRIDNHFNNFGGGLVIPYTEETKRVRLKMLEPMSGFSNFFL